MSKSTLSDEQILGLDDKHLIQIERHRLEHQTTDAFHRMQQAAKSDGITMTLASSHRNFERQAHIWNAKAQGKRPVLDAHSQPVAIDELDDDALMWHILNWSALPGTSRHHWGCDFDIFDGTAIKAEDLQLIPEEYFNSGPCAPLYQWLTTHANTFGFFWPYETYRGGVQIEPWHLSYAPISSSVLDNFPQEKLLNTIKQQKLELTHAIQRHLPRILKQYVFNVDPPPAIKETK